ncbi:hypothetical protein [Rhodococcus sp. T7]|uniref:hypothetical protein n=1 Tax=Rhodococcus sp. T7 TaxID=627444 RepID=UPI001356990C|nr:hypothetical protein [Rhodococcus sp. T7]KAF0965404.1 hypothetical protein MLGJGCBP_01451 [Rhodococcus sp. T7]
MFTVQRALGVTLVAASLTLAPVVGTTPQAAAEPTVNRFQIPLVWSTGLFTGCGWILDLCASTPTAIAGEQPGTVTFPVISPNSEATYWMHWRNLTTGAAGVLTVPYNESVSVFTGAGPVTASMTTGQEIIAGTGVFWVP